MFNRLPIALAAVLAACWTNGTSERGLTALMQISAPTQAAEVLGGAPPPGAQFFSGAMPKDEGGPTVTDIDSLQNIIYPGELNRPVTGRVTTDAQTVAIGLDGDVGYWVVPVGLPDFQYPGESDFQSTGQFSQNLPLGNQTIHFQASDSKGHFGPQNNQVLLSENVDAPHGYLVVHLEWDSQSDIDLHVEDPNGNYIWAKAPTTFQAPPPGSPPSTPAEIMNAGILQFDSNAMCVIDGLRQENAYWPQTVPSGTFTVRIDGWSMCGQQYAAWRVQVETRTDPTTPGTIIGTAEGMLYPRDVQEPHVAGSGAFALDFNYP